MSHWLTAALVSCPTLVAGTILLASLASLNSGSSISWQKHAATSGNNHSTHDTAPNFEAVTSMAFLSPAQCFFLMKVKILAFLPDARARQMAIIMQLAVDVSLMTDLVFGVGGT